jgi:hypothetical protein
MKDLIPGTVTQDQAKDTGMAMVLICLLIASFGGFRFFYGVAIVLLPVNMIWPAIFKPAAKIWLAFSHMLGSVMSGVLLTVIFLILVVPVGVVRRALGKDPLQLKKWKKDHASVFTIREHEFVSSDIKHPY